MNLDDFTQSLKEKTSNTLLEILELGQTGKRKIDPDFLGAIIDELYSRNLSEVETKKLEAILKLTSDAILSDAEKAPGQFSKDEMSDLLTKEGVSEPSKYSALKGVVGFISILGFVVAASGIFSLIYLASDNLAVFGIAAFVLSIVIAILLFAFSNLIYVFIDIEYNTRKTMEESKKKS